MKPPNSNGILPLTGALLAVGLSVWSLVAQHGLNQRLDTEAARLKKFSDLETEVATLSRKIGRIESRAGQMKPPTPPGTANSPGEIPQGEEALTGNLGTVARMDPGALESLQRKYTHEQAVKQQIQKLQITRQNQQKADFEKYGVAVQDLSRRIAAGGAGSDAAYSELLSKYPESNAAVSAIAEKGLEAAMEMDTEKVQSYFTQLMSKSGGTEAITEQGVQAGSALHSYLARNYISEGKYTEAQKIIDSLSQNYADELVPERGNGSEPQWVAGSELVTQLGTALSNASSGLSTGTGGPGNPPPSPSN